MTKRPGPAHLAMEEERIVVEEAQEPVMIVIGITVGDQTGVTVVMIGMLVTTTIAKGIIAGAAVTVR